MLSRLSFENPIKYINKNIPIIGTINSDKYIRERHSFVNNLFAGTINIISVIAVIPIIFIGVGMSDTMPGIDILYIHVCLVQSGWSRAVDHARTRKHVPRIRRPSGATR